jgi:hypothetical protein
MQDKRGILLLAMGHPYYARMAYNLLVSIRLHEPDLAVAIAVSGEGFGHLNVEQQSQFSKVIEIDQYADPYRAKLDLDKITPFHQTLFLDADMVWNNFLSPLRLMDDLSGRDFEIINRTRVSTSEKILSSWIDLPKVKEVYGFDEVYDISSELMYWEKGTKVFKTARKYYKNMKVEVKEFGAGFPDEAYLMLALEELEHKLFQTPWEPTYWQPRWTPRIHNEQHISQFYALSVGGAYTLPFIKKLYDRQVNHSFYSTGMPGAPFQLIPKYRIFKERRKI